MQIIEARVELETRVNSFSTLDWRHLSKARDLYISLSISTSCLINEISLNYLKLSPFFNGGKLTQTGPIIQNRE